MQKKYTILSLPSRRFPTEQPFLLEIMSKRLGQRGHRVISIIQSDTPLDKTYQMHWNDSQLFITPARSRRSSLNRMLNLIKKVQSLHKVYKDIFRNEKPDIIQVRNDWAAALWVLIIAKKQRIPFVFQYSFPGSKPYFERAKSLTGIKSFISKLTGSITKRLLVYIMIRADHVLPISQWMQGELIEWGIPEENMTPFPMGFNETILQQNVDINRIREEYKILDNPTVIYFGSMDKLRDLDFLIQAMSLVINKIPNARLLMVGGKPAEIKNLKLKAQELSVLDNTIFTGHVPYHEVPMYILSADIGVSPIPPIPMYIVSSPTKLAETLGLGRPIVCNDIPEQKKIILESGGGICVPYQEEDFAKAIIKLFESPALREEMGRMGQKYILQERSYSIMTDKLEAVYRKLISPEK